MLNLKIASIQQKNLISASEPWLSLLEITLDPKNAPNDILYLANNNEDVVFRGNTYIAFSFSLDALGNKSAGELPQLQLSVSNANRAIQAELERTQGGVDATVKLIVVNNQDLTSDDTELEVTFTITSSSCDVSHANFVLGAPNPLRQAFPSQYYLATYCRHRYNTPTMQDANDPAGRFCAYQGNLATCTHLKEGDNGCRAHDNLVNFGAQPSIDSTGFRRATTF